MPTPDPSHLLQPHILRLRVACPRHVPPSRAPVTWPQAWGLGEAFVGFVLLPIAGNAAEHSTAVVMAYKGKMDVALGVALGSSTQARNAHVTLMQRSCNAHVTLM